VTDRELVADDVLARLAAAGAMTLVPAAEGVPSLVALIAGGPVRGSWWSHPAGKRIYAIASALEASPDVLAAKLITGKVTYLHRRLWPALVRVVTDRGWRAARTAGLPAAAATLLAAVEASGALAGEDAAALLGGAAALKKARAALEERALVMTTSEHTERGHHAATLHAWSRWASPAVAKAARGLGLDAARAELAAAGVAL
jgi:hypothetical protein